MDISLRSVLNAGVVTVAASAIALAPAIQPLPTPAPKIEIAASSQAWLPTATWTSLEDVAAWAQKFFLPSAGASFPTLNANDAVQGTGINDSIQSIYNAIEPLVEWGFDTAAYVVGWIPWVGWFAPQISILYDFGEAIVRSVVFNGTDWLFGSLGFNEKISRIIGDVWDASWNLLQDEIRWLIPGLPIPLPPIPPCPDFLCSGWIGDAVVTASGWLRDGSLWIWDLWNNPIKPVIDGGIGIANDVFDALNWVPFVPLIQFETNSIWGLVQGVGDPLVGFAQDMIRAGDQAVADFFNGGLIAAAANATRATWDSIVLRVGEAIDAFVAFGQAQWDYFTGGFLDQRLGTAATAQRLDATAGLGSVSTLRAALRGDLTAGTTADIAGLRATVKDDIANLRAALRGDLTAGTTTDIAGLRATVKDDIANLRAALRGDLTAGTTTDIAGLRATVKDDIANLRAALRGDLTAGTTQIDAVVETTTLSDDVAQQDDVDTLNVPGTSDTEQPPTQSGDLKGFGRGTGHRHLRGLSGHADADAPDPQPAKDARGPSDVTAANHDPGDVTGGSVEQPKAQGRAAKPFGRNGALSDADNSKETGAGAASQKPTGKSFGKSGAGPDRTRAGQAKKHATG